MSLPLLESPRANWNSLQNYILQGGGSLYPRSTLMLFAQPMYPNISEARQEVNTSLESSIILYV